MRINHSQLNKYNQNLRMSRYSLDNSIGFDSSYLMDSELRTVRTNYRYFFPDV